MPKKISQPSPKHILIKYFFFFCAVLLLTYLVISNPKSTNKTSTNTLQVTQTSPTPTSPPTRQPQEFSQLEIDPLNIAVGDKYQNLILREIKSLSGNVSSRQDLEITFQGEIPLEATFIKTNMSKDYPEENLICTTPRRNVYTNIPLLKKASNTVSICITNSKDVEKYLSNVDPINFTIDNLTIHTAPDAPHMYTATFISLIK